jgi:hypothetical protein
MQLSFHLFILLLGFVLGNLFPTFFGDFLGKVGTPLFLFLALDFFNYFYYTNAFSKTLNLNRGKEPTPLARTRETGKGTFSPSSRTALPLVGSPELDNRTKVPGVLGVRWARIPSSIPSRANSLKIGFLFGLFVDAFKVGS